MSPLFLLVDVLIGFLIFGLILFLGDKLIADPTLRVILEL